jgi:hypothetical protein
MPDNVIIQIPQDTSTLPRAEHGDRRMVRFLPTPFGNRPAIWISPKNIIFDVGKGPERCRRCHLLLSDDPETSEVIPIYIPTEAIKLFPFGPVNW